MLEIITQNASKMGELEDVVATAEAIALSAIVVQDLKAKRNKVLYWYIHTCIYI